MDAGFHLRGADILSCKAVYLAPPRVSSEENNLVDIAGTVFSHAHSCCLAALVVYQAYFCIQDSLLFAAARSPGTFFCEQDLKLIVAVAVNSVPNRCHVICSGRCGWSSGLPSAFAFVITKYSIFL